MRYFHRYAAFALFASTLISCSKREAAVPGPYQEQIIFPFQDEHVHGSTLVTLPNGDVLSAWFQGSGERWADDVRIMGSRLVKGDASWSAPFLMANVKDFPDINPILFLDNQDRLWLMWYAVLANQWETSIPMYRLSQDYSSAGVPKWQWQETLLVKVGDKTERGIQPGDEFVKQVEDQINSYEQYLTKELRSSIPDSLWGSLNATWVEYKEKLDSLSRGRNMVRSGRIRVDGKEVSAELGYPLTRRLGWQTKNKAVYAGSRLIVPLYSDGFDCSLFAFTDDAGDTWSYSNPVLGGAGIQPTILVGKSGRLTAYLRDNGPPPQRMQRTDSNDNGASWSIAKDDILPNPGAGFDGVTLPGGEWVMVFNDTEEGRHNLSVALSDDEGKSWKWKKSIENDTRGDRSTSSHYPSVVLGADGRIHVTYSFHRKDTVPGKTIKYCSFTVDWIKN